MARYQHTKYQQIVKLISRRIRNGEYPDGKLPAARTLALEMGVSYLTALKALHELRASGLIGYDRSNRKSAIGRAATRHPLVGVITPFWGYSAWMQSINEVTAELGGAARFIAYSSDSDPLITEALSCPYDLFFIELPKHLDRRLRERIRKLGRRVVVLYSDMSAEGIRSLVGSSPESIELIMQRLLDSGRCRRIDAVGSPGEMDLDMQTRMIKLADLLDNTSSIVSRDPEFSAIYLAEKELMLAVLFDGKEIGKNIYIGICDNVLKGDVKAIIPYELVKLTV